MFRSKWLISVRTFTIGWIIGYIFWAAFRNVGSVTDINSQLSELQKLNLNLTFLVLTIIAGILFGSIQYFMEKRQRRARSFAMVLLRSLAVHSLIMLVLYLTIYLLFRYGLGQEDLLFRDFLLNPSVILNFVYTLLVNSAIVVFIYLNKLLGEGNLLKLLTGKFSKPREEERVFMFIDLTDSTRIAEELGHLKYSAFIQDCFNDLNSVESTGAKVYQYVGDEVVLTWNAKNLDIEVCMDAFYLFRSRLKERKAYYESNYGIQPAFKAGMHVGIITAVEVGSIKREIAYHGDTINMASRIQGHCKVAGSIFLISNAVFKAVSNSEKYHLDPLDLVLLAGKKTASQLYAVNVSYNS